MSLQPIYIKILVILQALVLIGCLVQVVWFDYDYANRLRPEAVLMVDRMHKAVAPRSPIAYFEETQPFDPDSLDNWILVQKYTTVKYGCSYDGDCDYNGVLNARTLAEAKLWPVIEDGHNKVRAPCGGQIDCQRMLSPNVSCFVEVTNCNFGKPKEGYRDPKVLKTYLLECRGDVACSRDADPPKDCCLITNVINGMIVH